MVRSLPSRPPYRTYLKIEKQHLREISHARPRILTAIFPRIRRDAPGPCSEGEAIVSSLKDFEIGSRIARK